MTGLITSNTPGATTGRIMVGKYNDPAFGKMDVKGYSNYAPPATALTPTINATVDSLILQLRFDLTHYGSTSASTQHLQVFELLEPLKSSVTYVSGPSADANGNVINNVIADSTYYYNNSVIATSSTVVGDITFPIDPSQLNDAIINAQDADTTNDFTLKLRIKISNTNLANNLLTDMASNPSLFNDFASFSRKYLGFAFVMESGDQILSINPNFTAGAPSSKQTKLSLYYTDSGIQSQADFVLNYSFNFSSSQENPVTNFSTYTSDYSSTSLSGIQPFVDYEPYDHYFVQGSTALITKIDLTDFYKYFDTIQNASFSSAQLVLSNTSTMPPIAFQFRVLDKTNHFDDPSIDTVVSDVNTVALNYYYSKMNSGSTSVLSFTTSATDTVVNIITDMGVAPSVLSDTYQIPDVYITDFLQKAYKYRTDPRRINNFALMPQAAEFNTNVNTFILDKSVILKIYFSKPVIGIP